MNLLEVTSSWEIYRYGLQGVPDMNRCNASRPSITHPVPSVDVVVPEAGLIASRLRYQQRGYASCGLPGQRLSASCWQADQGCASESCCPLRHRYAWPSPPLPFTEDRRSTWRQIWHPPRPSVYRCNAAETATSATSAASPPLKGRLFSPSTTWTRLFRRPGSGISSVWPRALLSLAATMASGTPLPRTRSLLVPGRTASTWRSSAK